MIVVGLLEVGFIGFKMSATVCTDTLIVAILFIKKITIGMMITILRFWTDPPRCITDKIMKHRTFASNPLPKISPLIILRTR